MSTPTFLSSIVVFIADFSSCYIYYRDFTCDQCMRMETGLSKVRDQYLNNKKVRQIIGDSMEIQESSRKKNSGHKQQNISPAVGTDM